MKVNNLHIYGSPERINYLYDEYAWLARNEVKRESDTHLIVFAKPRKRSSNKKKEEELPSKPRRHNKGYSDKRNPKRKEINDGK